MSKFTRIQCLFLGLILFFSLSAFRFQAQESVPNGYDLVAAVNAYRAANGYYQIPVNSLVMSAAQTHAEWIVETGQGGHIGAGGSNETMRVSWTGYGGGLRSSVMNLGRAAGRSMMRSMAPGQTGSIRK